MRSIRLQPGGVMPLFELTLSRRAQAAVFAATAVTRRTGKRPLAVQTGTPAARDRAGPAGKA